MGGADNWPRKILVSSLVDTYRLLLLLPAMLLPAMLLTAMLLRVIGKTGVNSRKHKQPPRDTSSVSHHSLFSKFVSISSLEHRLLFVQVKYHFKSKSMEGFMVNKNDLPTSTISFSSEEADWSSQTPTNQMGSASLYSRNLRGIR